MASVPLGLPPPTYPMLPSPPAALAAPTLVQANVVDIPAPAV